jgi:hypothetical protein
MAAFEGHHPGDIWMIHRNIYPWSENEYGMRGDGIRLLRKIIIHLISFICLASRAAIDCLPSLFRSPM